MKKLLIVGCNGFIGTHVSSFLSSSKKYLVHGCDIHKESIVNKYFQIDQINPEFNQLFKQNQYDFCINCSGAASVPESILMPLNDFNLNVINVFTILNEIKISQSDCSFINLSSAAVYGNQSELPIVESSILNPISPYGIHKKNAEEICKEFYSFFGVKCCNLRIFSAYGNGLKKQLFWDLYQKIKNYEVVELFGTGNETRDFIHVDDIAKVIELCINSEFNLEYINVANGIEYSIKNISEIFVSFFHSRKTIIFNQKVKIGDPQNWCANITKLKTLGYNCTVPIEVGLNNYYKWANEN